MVDYGMGNLRSVSKAIEHVAPDAEVLVDFKTRIDQYMALHNKLKKESPRLKETKNPSEIKASQDVLAMKIREARKTAKQGDIFTLEIRQLCVQSASSIRR